MHYTLNNYDFQQVKKTNLRKWRKNEELVEFADYFENQWLVPPFDNWQIFKTRKNGLGFILKLADPSRSYKINVDTYECTCSECLNCNCVYFLDHAICKHVLYICEREKIELPGLVKKRTFSTRNKKGRPRNASRALQRD